MIVNILLSISSTLELIEKYGLSLVLLIIVGFAFWQLLKKLLKSQDKQIVELQNNYSAIMNKLMDDDKVKESFLENAEDANKVQILLYHMLGELEADRISLFEYHNGGKTLNGVSFRKCTNTFEAVSLNTQPKIKEFQNLPITINVIWNKLLITRSPIIIENIEDIKEIDSSVYTTLKVDDVKSYYSFIISDYDTKPIGFLTVEFYQHTVMLDEKELSHLKDHINTISGLIS